MKKNIKIAYIGGGSKMWARIFMFDLALANDIEGTIALYDIDKEAAVRNQMIGDRINANKDVVSKFKYEVHETIDTALKAADFVIISILPGTFEEMRADVHAPEKYGIYQSVGDTVGPGGVFRAMRTVPMYEFFATKIKEICPKAWVINFTNPMTICVKTLYDVFPEIKAFGCCHEVFHAQEFLCVVLKEMKGINATRHDIYTDASGINHFTWITEAKYKDIDLLKLLPSFMDKFYEEGYCEQKGMDRFAFKTDPFMYGNKVKMNLFSMYGALAAAGDRHLVEFLPNSWYLKDKKTVKDWKFNLTEVDYREKQLAERIEETLAMVSGNKEIILKKSDEEAVELMKAIMGFQTIVSNVNMPNYGQMKDLPLGSIVETNCVFSNDQVHPITAKTLPTAVKNLVYRNSNNIDLTYEGIKERDLQKLFLAFMNQPLCNSLTMEDGKKLFKEMCEGTRKYIEPYFELDSFYKTISD